MTCFWHTWLVLQLISSSYPQYPFSQAKATITTDIEGIRSFQLTPKTKIFFVSSEELKNPIFFFEYARCVFGA